MTAPPGDTGSIRDKIRIRNLSCHVPLQSPAPWPALSAAQTSSRYTTQPVMISVSLELDLSAVAASDDLAQGPLDYSSLADSICSSCCPNGPGFGTLDALAGHVQAICAQHCSSFKALIIELVQPKASPYASSIGLEWRSFLPSALGTFLLGPLPGTRLYRINDMTCSVIIGVHPFEREETQTIHINVSITTSPDIGVLDCRSISRSIHEAAVKSLFKTLEALASSLAHLTQELVESKRHINDESGQTTGPSVSVRISKPSALVFADAAEVEVVLSSGNTPLPPQVAPKAMVVPQDLPSTISIPASPSADFATLLASVLAEVHPAPADPEGMHTAAIALGGNVGDRFANIERALRLLEQPHLLLSSEDSMSLSIVDTSFMYETAPMYVTDQPMFINCACLVKTTLKPLALLTLCKRIEVAVGRQPSIRNGPRAVDLDILLYDDLALDTRPADEDSLDGHLVVPHPRLAEREFVLRPLADMMPEYVHPATGVAVQTLLDALLAASPPDTPPMYKVTPFPRYPLPPAPPAPATKTAPLDALFCSVPSTATYWKFPLPPPANLQGRGSAGQTKTYLMATLNATPDSFSDGGAHGTLPAARHFVLASVRAGADMVDVGGYSTRPGAAFVSSDEESARVVPIIQAIRKLGTNSPAEKEEKEEQEGSERELESRAREVLISVDTFRADVARAAIEAGANCLNDVYAFAGPAYPPTHDSALHFGVMRDTARALAVPVVLMHSRGDAGSNKDYTAFDDDIISAVRAELGARVGAAVCGAGGLRRWLVLVDPGLGFSKSLADNLALLRDGARLTAPAPGNLLAGFPQLVGASRKSFLGLVLADNGGRATVPAERGWATAAAVTCAVQQGAAVVRVHDVQEQGDVVRVADALWR